MKRIGILTTLIVLLFVTMSHGFNTVHAYINGKVNSIHSNAIVIEDHEYIINENCKVVIASRDNGIFHEKPASINDVRKGDTVTAKKIANTLYEIMIERWR